MKPSSANAPPRLMVALLAGFGLELGKDRVHADDLAAYSEIQSIDLTECSGIVKSRQLDGIYWAHSDSAGGSNLYAFDRMGALIAIARTRIRNVDWEDIAADDQGNLFIGDFGNFDNTRKNLAIYSLREPTDLARPRVRNFETYPFEYPDQTSFPPAKRIYDCEALFWVEGHLFLLTKSLGDTFTRLYRFHQLEPEVKNRPEHVGTFDIGPRVTAADASPDGQRLAVLTTRSVWVFDRPEDSWNYLSGKAVMRPIRAGQCEAICWENQDRLIVANENRALFAIPVDSLVEY